MNELFVRYSTEEGDWQWSEALVQEVYVENINHSWCILEVEDGWTVEQTLEQFEVDTGKHCDIISVSVV